MRNMIGFVIAPASLLTVGFLVAYPIYQQTGGRPELAGLFDFEAPHTGDVPQGWGGGPAGTFAVDGQIVHSGRWALRIDRNEKSPGAFSTVTKMLPIDFAGTRLELHGFLRTQDVSDFAGLWMREDGDSWMASRLRRRRASSCPRRCWISITTSMVVRGSRSNS
jgi:hypothetical protein